MRCGSNEAVRHGRTRLIPLVLLLVGAAACNPASAADTAGPVAHIRFVPDDRGRPPEQVACSEGGGAVVITERAGMRSLTCGCCYTGGEGSHIDCTVPVRPGVPNTLVVREMHVSCDPTDPNGRDLLDIHTNPELAFDQGKPVAIDLEAGQTLRQRFRAGPHTTRIHGVAVGVDRTGFERIDDMYACPLRLRLVDEAGKALAGPVLMFPPTMPGDFGWVTFWMPFPAKVEPSKTYAIEITADPRLPDSCRYRLRALRGPRPERLADVTLDGEPQSDAALAIRIGPAHRTCYDIVIDGKPWRPEGALHSRDLYDYGVGPLSTFIDLPPQDKTRVRLRFINRMPAEVNRVYIADVRSIAELDDWARRFDTSYVVGFVPPHGVLRADRCAEIVARGFQRRRDDVTAGNAVEPALCVDYPYLHRDASRAKADLESYAQLATKHDLRLQIGLSSTWVGTPGEPFRAPEFQQIVYSKTDTHWDAGIRSLGPPYDRDVHYGFSYPNMWSSCPWLSVSHPKLRAFKRERLRQAATILKQLASDRLALVMGDNEPAYWGYQMWFADTPYMKPNDGARRLYPIADVGPAAVAAARRDGVTLDPTDGLSKTERTWLARHLSEALQDSYGVLADVLGPDAPIYVQVMACAWYPQDNPFRPGFEIGLLKGGPKPGLESNIIRRKPGMLEWGQADDRPYFERAINLGPAAQVNHETCMSRPEELREALQIGYRFGLTNYIFYNAWNKNATDVNPSWKEPIMGLADSITPEMVKQRRRSLVLQHLAAADAGRF